MQLLTIQVIPLFVLKRNLALSQKYFFLKRIIENWANLDVALDGRRVGEDLPADVARATLLRRVHLHLVTPGDGVIKA
jgi:hypothetical protein